VSLRKIANDPIAGLLLLVIIIWIAWQAKGLILLLFTAMLVTLLLLPLVDGLKKLGLPRSLGAVTVMLGLIALATLFFFIVIPPLAGQSSGLADSIQSYATGAQRLFGHQVSEEIAQSAADFVRQVSRSAVSITAGAIGVISSVFVVVFFSLYWLIDYHNIKRNLIAWVRKSNRQAVTDVAEGVETHMIDWLRGLVILSVLMGLLAAVAYSLIGLPYIFLLAVLAGAFEIIPFIGPILGAVPAVIVALTISPTKAILVVVAYAIMQAIESNVLAPNVMGRAVNLHPLVIILSILIGGRLAGIPGVLLAIPAAVAVTEVAKGVQQRRSTR
jgi:predicted PurR-regulated permease PerM